jgi:hypothetical protein
MKFTFTARRSGYTHVNCYLDEDEQLPTHTKWDRGETTVSVGRTGKVRTKPRKPHVIPGKVQMTDEDGALLFYEMSDSGNRVYCPRGESPRTREGYKTTTDATYTHAKYENYKGYNEETGKYEYENVAESEKPCDPVMVPDYDSEDVTFSSEEEINHTWWESVRKTNIRI